MNDVNSPGTLSWVFPQADAAKLVPMGFTTATKFCFKVSILLFLFPAQAQFLGWGFPMSVIFAWNHVRQVLVG